MYIIVEWRLLLSYIVRSLSVDGRKHNKIVVLTGVSGSGKDFLSTRLEKRFHNSSITFAEFGELLYESLANRFGISSRDDIGKKLSTSDIAFGTQEVITRLMISQPMVLTGHVFRRQQADYVYAPSLERNINGICYVFVWANPEQILEWRNKDHSRERTIESVGDIALHQDLSLEVVTTTAKHLGSALHTIWNRTDNFQTNLDELEYVLVNLLGSLD